MTLTNSYESLSIPKEILPDAAKTPEPTLLTDAGYDGLRCRRFEAESGFRPLIPVRSCIPTEQAVGELYAVNPGLQRKRYVVERMLGWLKGFRRLRHRGTVRLPRFRRLWTSQSSSSGSGECWPLRHVALVPRRAGASDWSRSLAVAPRIDRALGRLEEAKGAGVGERPDLGHAHTRCPAPAARGRARRRCCTLPLTTSRRPPGRSAPAPG